MSALRSESGKEPATTQAMASIQTMSSRTALPVASWLLFFLVVPTAIVTIYSFARRGTYGDVEWAFTEENYIRAFDWLYLKVFWQSLKLAVATTVSCLVIGYPMAFVMASASKRWRSALMILVVVPFWTNFVVRTYAIKAAFSETGPLNQWAIRLGWISEPIPFTGTYLAIWMGMVSNYLPFMVLPLYVVLEKFDFTLLEAARDLGANRWQQLTRVLIPMTKPGIISGSVFVFAPALGEFVIPDLLGGARTLLVGNLITEQFLKTRDWPFGSALAILLIFGVLCAALSSLLLRKSFRAI